MNDPDKVDIGYWLDEMQLLWFNHVTVTSVEQALDGFTLTSEKDIRWMVAQIRHSQFCTIGIADRFDGYPGLQTVRRELQTIAKSIERTRAAFNARTEWAESILRRFNYLSDKENKEAPNWTESHEAFVKDWWNGGNEILRAGSAQWTKFDDIVKGLAFAQEFIEKAAEQLCSRDDPPRWKDGERRKDRVAFAVWLSAVFETAYGRPATFNNWPDEDGKPRHGPWADFYVRISRLVFKSSNIPDVAGVLKAARKERLGARRGD